MFTTSPSVPSCIIESPLNPRNREGTPESDRRFWSVASVVAVAFWSIVSLCSVIALVCLGIALLNN